MKSFRVMSHNTLSVLLALLISAFVFVIISTQAGGFSTTDESVYLRTVYVAATGLLMYDVLTCASFARGAPRNLRSPHFWIFAFYMGYFWLLLMVLLRWEGIEGVKGVFIKWSGPAVFFGLMMSWVGVPNKIPLDNRYDLEKPVAGQSLGILYYIWPVVVVALNSGFLLAPPTDGWGENYLLFQMIFLGSLLPLYPFMEGQFWKHFWPRGLGYIFLFVGLRLL